MLNRIYIVNLNNKQVDSNFIEWLLEYLIYQKQKAYYDVHQTRTNCATSATFVEFILQMILDAIVASSSSDQDTAQDTVQASDQVKRLIEKMGHKEYSLSELMALLDLSHRATFQKNYLNPALEAGLLERTLPDKPKSPKQKYKLKK